MEWKAPMSCHRRGEGGGKEGEGRGEYIMTGDVMSMIGDVAINCTATTTIMIAVVVSLPVVALIII
eukprot:2766963-Pyramimonas_sp.AAC.1